MSNRRPPRLRIVRALALVWLLAVLAAFAHNIRVWGFAHPPLDSDVMALLPRDARDPIVEAAFDRMAGAMERRVVVLVGAQDADAAKQAADAYLGRLAGVDAEVRHTVSGEDFAAWRSFFAPYHGVLIGEQGRAVLAQGAPTQADFALSRLFSPSAGGGLAWKDDPFGFFAGWMMEQAAGQNVRPVDGRLWLTGEGRQWAVILLKLKGAAFSFDAQDALMPRLDAAALAARAATPGVVVRVAGVAPVAAAVAGRARTEMSAIGLGSTLGVILLVGAVFRRPRPLILTLLPIVVGTVCAISLTLLVFPRVHLLTLVFGASLVGVAVDYGLFYLAHGVGETPFDPVRRRSRLFAALLMALLTTVIAYIGLALTPFPGFRQMAVFAAAGLIAAWLTVMLWFPTLAAPDRGTASVEAWMGRLRARWPVFGQGRWGWALPLALSVLTLAGLSQLVIRDDVRTLQAAPINILKEQARVAQLAGLPSPAQFFLVRGDSPEQVLQREEALATRLAPLVAQKILGGYQSVARHLPSEARQRTDCAQLRAAYAHPVWRARIEAATGLDASGFASALRCEPLRFDAWLAHPASEAFRGMWMGHLGKETAAVTLLYGLHGAEAVARLQAATAGLPGVTWVDKPTRISSILARYRTRMMIVVGLGYLAGGLLLTRRYGRAAWRVIALPLTASALAVAVLALAGFTFQLFAALGLFLVLGMGVDYGIFLFEHPQRDLGRPWLATSLAALTAQLSFGLLALSSTPALQVFGLTTLVGIGASWLLAPCLAVREAT